MASDSSPKPNPTDSTNSTPSRQISTMIWVNFATIVAIIFFSGVTYQRLAAVELRVAALELRDSQFQAISAMQAQIKALEAEVVRARDRVDRAVDMVGRGQMGK